MRPLVRDGGERTREYPENRVRHGATSAERILRYARVDGNGCWIWTGYVDRRTGYGRVLWAGSMGYAHRVSYETFVGAIPAGLQIDHLCRVRACCNPKHLEPVTPRENTRRSPHTHGHETHCPHGHAYDEANTYRTTAGRRHCRTCRTAYLAIYRAMTDTERRARKQAGLPVVDLATYFSQERAA